MANLVILSGNLGNDPELRHTKSGRDVAVFDIATTETWQGSSGKEKHTEWTRIEVWGGLAKACAEYLQKGSRVLATGKLHTNQWETDGEKKFAKVVRASEVEFLDSKN
ncbi:hypothetical protein DSCO28_73000 (plasmid) [Desulfosarcina ovata subsp. sediminis]|uniref:Single-stranded DNA-binding protein n=1 Tax=Desulfosarcina ovata subsp. sediminis TaxID=885957 RepID=A0A5K8A303_9BACT|nr:single-stranded DNA-binding protein [Desulfosarcina ovata]BBO86734.1 hypothetical protein DSCO28_73000 [Desulfosarcina ovata subsp. sediminis]